MLEHRPPSLCAKQACCLLICDEDAGGGFQRVTNPLGAQAGSLCSAIFLRTSSRDFRRKK